MTAPRRQPGPLKNPRHWWAPFILALLMLWLASCCAGCSVAAEDIDAGKWPSEARRLKNFAIEWSIIVGQITEEQATAILDSNADGYVSFAEYGVGGALLRRVSGAMMKDDPCDDPSAYDYRTWTLLKIAWEVNP